MTVAERLASFVARASLERMSAGALSALKVRVLDALGCAIGALDGEPVRLVRAHVEEFSSGGPCALIGGGTAPPDLAALYNGALVRYLDYNDSYLAPGETCHPSDNLGAVLAASEYAGGGGSALLAALAVAYQVQCRLSDEAPVRDRGFDHTTQGAYAASAGVARALGLDLAKTANAVAISGTALNALRVTRTGPLSHWKGLAYPWTGFAATQAAFLARRGITGPPQVFEGNKGFMETIAGRFEIDWEHEDLERVRLAILKRYNAEVHSQSALEALLELRAEVGLRAGEVDRVDLEVFDVAYNIIGGGEEGSKTVVRTKEEADHSLPYLAAVALLDGEVTPRQYRPERIRSRDVQDLLRQVHVRPSPELSRRFPREMPCRVRVTLRDGRSFNREKSDYQGFHTRPMDFEAASAKFESLSGPFTGPALGREIAQAVAQLESIPVAKLTALLQRVSPSPTGGPRTEG